MTDLTTTVALSGVTDIKYDDSRGLLYLSSSSGVFYRWAPATGAFTSSIGVGGPSSAFDLTADGRYALVNRSDTGAIDRLDLAGLDFAKLSLPLSNPYNQGMANIATTSAGQALVTFNFGSPGELQLYQFGASAPSISLSPVLGGGHDPAFSGAYLNSSESHRYVLLGEANGTGLHLYDSAAGAITRNIYYPGLTTQHADISEAAGLILEAKSNGVYIFDFALAQKTFVSVAQLLEITSAEFSADGHQFFLVQRNRISGEEQIAVYDTLSWAQVGTITTPTNLGYMSTVAMTRSADGRLLFVANDSMFEVIDLSARLHLTVQGDEAHTRLYGSVGSDIIIGSAADDIIDGGGGDDILTGGGGGDTFIFRPGAGAVTITDFSHAEGDVIDLSGFYRYTALSQVLALAAPSGADTIIDFGGGFTLTLKNIAPTSLVASDFIFTTGPIKVGNTTITTDPALNLSLTSGPLAQFTAQFDGVLVNNGSLTLNSSTYEVGIGTYVSPSGGVFENYGLFSVTAAGAVGVGAATTHNHSAFTVTGTGAGNGAGASSGDFVNEGSVIVTAPGSAIGVKAWSLFQNLAGATFSVSSSGATASGVVLDGSGEFDNFGTFTVSAATSATGLTIGTFAGPSVVNNGGTITVTGSSSLGVWAPISLGYAVNLTNSGTISAETAIQYFTLGTITNSGRINGAVILSSNNQLVNTGVINGAISLGSGNTLDSHLGTITGTISLGSGSSTAMLGAEDNTVALAAGTHMVDGGGGTNTVSYAGAAAGVHVSLALQGQAQSTGVGTDTLLNFQALVGSAHGDTLEGGGSAFSTLTGGLGADTFVYRLGDGQVTITDFSHAQGDRLDLRFLPNFHNLNDVLRAATQSGADTVIAFGGGESLTLHNVQRSSLVAGDFLLSSLNSVNGDGATEVLFRHVATGDWGYMSVNPSGGQTWHAIGPSSPGYAMIGTGDFDGDGMLDVAFRNTATGDWGFLTPNPSGGQTWHAVGASSLGYAAVAAQDFNGDGSIDIAFRNPTTGDWGYMSVNPAGGQTWHAVGPSSTDYVVIGSGDFNGDGLQDLAFRQVSTGDWGFLTPMPSGGQTWHAVGPTSLAYAPIAALDFNNDGTTDIAFRNPTTGDWGYMSVNPAGGQTWHAVGPSSTDYSVIAAGDFDGDGLQDVAFRQVSTGDWGFLTPMPSGGQTWRFVGPSSTDYLGF